MDNTSTHNMEAITSTKLTKFPTPFTIESLIANHQHASTKSSDDSINSLEVSEELSARAMVASSALGLTNFPLYNPWLHGYFAQNHDRITQLFANGGEYNTMPLNLLSKEPSSANESVGNTNVSLTQNPQTLNLSKSSCESENQLQHRLLFNPNFGLSIASAAASSTNSPAMSINEALLHQSALAASDLNSRQRLAEIMAASGLHDNVQNLTMASRFAQNMGKVFTDAAALTPSSVPPTLFHHHVAENSSRRESLSNCVSVKNHSEASLDVGGMDEDYDCSGDSCSDISLTMSPQNYRTEMDKSRGKPE